MHVRCRLRCPHSDILCATTKPEHKRLRPREWDISGIDTEFEERQAHSRCPMQVDDYFQIPLVIGATGHLPGIAIR